jgi:hypothetical protein
MPARNIVVVCSGSHEKKVNLGEVFLGEVFLDGRARLKFLRALQMALAEPT